MENKETKQESRCSPLTSDDLLCRPLIKKILEYAADQCNGLQAFPTQKFKGVPPAEQGRHRAGYNEGVTDAADAVENLDIKKMLHFIRDKEKRDVEKGRNPQTTGLFEW